MVAIKDMKMPKYCNDCDFVIDSFGYCNRAEKHIPNYEFYSDTNERPDFCPLVEIEERKIGKWIRVDHTKVKCSNCDITHLIAQYPHGVIDYCPNCGSYNQSIIENER